VSADVTNWSRWVALCAAGLLCACPASGDDDDFVGDDDDAVGDDDDAGDDDDFGFSFESVTLRGSVVAFSAGDDDDSAADDDDVADDDDDVADDDDAVGDDDDVADDDDSASGDDDDSAGAGVTARDAVDVEGTFVIDYWRDFDNSLLECTQTLTWSGTADFGPGLVSDCAGCTGVLEVTAATVMDASNRATDPEACDPADLAAAGVDFGARLTGGGSPAGGGLLQLGLMDLATAVDLDVQPTRAGTIDLVAQAEQIGATGNVLTHVGFVSSTGGTFFDDIGFDTVAGPSGAGEPWSVFWFVYRPDPTGSPPETDLSGAYQLGSFWILQ